MHPFQDGFVREFRLSSSDAREGRKTALYIAGGLVVVVTGFAALSGGNSTAIIASILITGLIGGIIVGNAVWTERRAARDRGVHIRVDTGGITAPPYADRPIPWSAIEGISFRRNKNGPITLGVRIINHKAYGLRGASRWLAGINKMLGGGQLIIDTEPLEGTPGDLLRAIQTASPSTPISANCPLP